MTRTYDLKLEDGKVVQFQGTSGENAAERYIDCMGQSAVVVAVRIAAESAYGLRIGVNSGNIIG